MRLVTILAIALMLPQLANAHCDSLAGPVITEARAALAAGNLTPVLKWVTPDQEEQVRKAFEHVMRVRSLGDDAQELADRFFFETLVRLHRASEGAPYTGLKPGGSEDYAVEAAADRALAGSVDGLATKVAESAAAGIRERYARARSAKAHEGESVEAGRKYVAAYVEYVHYVLGVHNAVAASEVHHHGAEVKVPVASGEAHGH